MTKSKEYVMRVGGGNVISDPEFYLAVVLKVEREQNVYYNSGSLVLDTPTDPSEFIHDPIAGEIRFLNAPEDNNEMARVTFKY